VNIALLKLGKSGWLTVSVWSWSDNANERGQANRR
jgi:hypothetical protein